MGSRAPALMLGADQSHFYEGEVSMRRLGWFGLVFVVVCASASVASASATATLPSLLPEATGANPVGFTSSSEASSFESGIGAFTSTKSKGNGTGFSLKLGALLWLLEDVSNELDEGCTGLASGQKAGDIEVTGTFHVRDAKETVGVSLTLVVAIIFLILPVHFSCGDTSMIETGCLAGLLLYGAPKSKEVTIDFEKVKGKNDNKIIFVLTEGNEREEACELKSSENGGPAVLTSVETFQKWAKFHKGAEEVSVEVMPL